MSDRVLTDGEIIRHDDNVAPTLIHIRLLPVLALAFCLGAALGYAI